MKGTDGGRSRKTNQEPSVVIQERHSSGHDESCLDYGCILKAKQTWFPDGLIEQ